MTLSDSTMISRIPPSRHIWTQYLKQLSPHCRKIPHLMTHSKKCAAGYSVYWELNLDGLLFLLPFFLKGGPPDLRETFTNWRIPALSSLPVLKRETPVQAGGLRRAPRPT